MQKFSHLFLRLPFKKSYFWVASLFATHFMFSTSCQTQYKGIGDYKSPGDYKSGNSATPSPLFPLALPTENLSISRGFLPRRGRKRKHLGLDIRGHLNDPIFSSHFGRVVYAGRKFSGYGNMILIEYNDEWATLYAHLNKMSVKSGDFVKRGQKIGYMGRTGRATGVHLHFELIKQKKPINPLPYVNSKGNQP